MVLQFNTNNDKEDILFSFNLKPILKISLYPSKYIIFYTDIRSHLLSFPKKILTKFFYFNHLVLPQSFCLSKK